MGGFGPELGYLLSIGVAIQLELFGEGFEALGERIILGHVIGGVNLVCLVHWLPMVGVPKTDFLLGKLLDLHVGIGLEKTKRGTVVPAVPVVQLRAGKKHVTKRVEIPENLRPPHQAGVEPDEVHLVPAGLGQGLTDRRVHLARGHAHRMIERTFLGVSAVADKLVAMIPQH